MFARCERSTREVRNSDSKVAQSYCCRDDQHRNAIKTLRVMKWLINGRHTSELRRKGCSSLHEILSFL